VSVLLHLSLAAVPKKEAPLIWFSTKSTVDEYKQIDFRGCYGPECVYVSHFALYGDSKNLGPYLPTQKLWSVAYSDKIEYLFSQERPKELSDTLWVTPVADSSVRPAVFNATRFYRTEADPHIEEFISRIDGDEIYDTVVRLAAYNSRNSQSPDTINAANWLRSHIEDLGCENAQLINFRAGWAPNVLCEISGTDSNAPAVVVGAHYDSRGPNVNSPTQRAPGADDNASGSASILEILRVATTLIRDEGFSFQTKLIFVFFAGEEQGLVGSAALATSYVNSGIDLTAMVNLDMIGYPDPTFPTTLYWMSGSTTSALTQLAIQLTREYLGENTLLATTSACCSDQQSFYSRGYPAASIFESRSAGYNPNYHQSSDLPSTVNFNHVLRNARSAAALITTLSEISGPL